MAPSFLLLIFLLVGLQEILSTHSRTAPYHQYHRDRHFHPEGHYWGQHWSLFDTQKWTEELNKRVVLNFYHEFFGDKKIEAADKYISAHKYIQHNPTVPDGREAFKNEARKWFQGALPEVVDIKRVAADGDLVWLHIKTNEGGKVGACVDIFRLECGKIVEHWDVMMELPENSANPHPLF